MFLWVKDNVGVGARVKAKVSCEHCQVTVRPCGPGVPLCLSSVVRYSSSSVLQSLDTVGSQRESNPTFMGPVRLCVSVCKGV